MTKPLIVIMEYMTMDEHNNLTKKHGGRRNPPGGRPRKGNVILHCHVAPDTLAAIDREASKLGMTRGEMVDRLASHLPRE